MLRHDFGPAELEGNLSATGIDAAISVQARTHEVENGFLLDYAKKHKFIAGVVGYIDLTKPDAGHRLDAFAGQGEGYALGVREVLQGLPDDYGLREDFNRGVSLLHDFGFTYDVLIKHHQLENSIQLVDKHPAQVFVLDHIAKPEIASAEVDPAWAENIKKLAEREHVYCKVSGMVTEVAPTTEWTAAMLEPYFQVVWQAFGPRRVMFGSDWPVCLLRSHYTRWVETVRSWTSDLSDTEQADFWGGNAVRAYGLEL